MTDRDALLRLSALWGAHDRVTHWAISMRVAGKGDFFDRLMRGHGCRAATERRVLAAISDQWPDDLPWPADIPRPAPRRPEDAA